MEVLDRVDPYYDVPNEIVVDNTIASRSGDTNNSSSRSSNDTDTDNHKDDLDVERTEQNNQTEEQASTVQDAINVSKFDSGEYSTIHTLKALLQLILLLYIVLTVAKTDRENGSLSI